jgi:hypothetical protein
VGGTLLLVGAIAGLSQCIELLNVLQHSTETARDAMLAKHLTTKSVVYGAHFVLLAVAGYLIVRGSKRSVWFLSFSVFSWVVVVAVSVWIAKNWATEEGWENIQPIGIIFLNAVRKRFVMVLPSIIGLLFVLARSPKEGISSD